MHIRWRAVLALLVVIAAALALGIRAWTFAPMDSLTVVLYLIFGTGLVLFVFHRSPRG